MKSTSPGKAAGVVATQHVHWVVVRIGTRGIQHGQQLGVTAGVHGRRRREAYEDRYNMRVEKRTREAPTFIILFHTFLRHGAVHRDAVSCLEYRECGGVGAVRYREEKRSITVRVPANRTRNSGHSQIAHSCTYLCLSSCLR